MRVAHERLDQAEVVAPVAPELVGGLIEGAVDHDGFAVVEGVRDRGGVCVILADHGNCETMFEKNKRGEFVEGALPGNRKACTTHTLNPVPCIITGEGLKPWAWSKAVDAPGLANVAATCFNLLGFEAPEGFMPSLIERA